MAKPTGRTLTLLSRDGSVKLIAHSYEIGQRHYSPGRFLPSCSAENRSAANRVLTSTIQVHRNGHAVVHRAIIRDFAGLRFHFVAGICRPGAADLSADRSATHRGAGRR